MKPNLKAILQASGVTFVTRDYERATGLPPTTPGFFIISNSTPSGKAKVHDLFIDEGEPLDTLSLLKHPLSHSFIESHGKQVLVFKNTSFIESTCKEQGWRLLNPSASLARTVEEKISQIEWLGELSRHLPEHRVDTLEKISWGNKPFILQFNRTHTGLGTYFISSQADLQELQKQFPKRPSKSVRFLQGPAFTTNVVVAKDVILTGNISYQITGLQPFTDNSFATIGNDWALPHAILSEQQKEKIFQIAQNIGEKLRSEGWKGLFGIDVMVEEKTKEVFLIEINARQPASTSFESQLQEKNRQIENEITTFEAHLLALLDQNLSECKIIELKDGAQIVERVKEKKSETNKEQINISDIQILEYKNTEIGSDLRRFQTPHSFMREHNVLNEVGNHIATLIS